MNRPILLLCLFFVFTGHISAQTKKKSKTKTQKTTQTVKPNVYYPDYYTFYDSTRGGYLYWKEDKWIFSKEPPYFMKDVNAKELRVRVLKDENNTIPEDRFEQYLKLYPPQPVSPTVPVPIITITPGR